MRDRPRAKLVHTPQIVSQTTEALPLNPVTGNVDAETGCSIVDLGWNLESCCED